MRVVTILFLLFNYSAFANQLTTTSIPHPLFLKQGFSSIIEFDQNPLKIVIGDNQAFQIEKMDKSLVVRALVSYATSNLFVYFKDAPPKLFTLTVSEDATPSLYNKFDVTPLKAEASRSETEKKAITANKVKVKTGTKLTSAKFDKTKDYLTIDFVISADSTSVLAPKWDLIRLNYGDKKIAPYKVWSERQEIQKDSAIKARLIFLRPNIDKSLSQSSIIIPLKGRADVLNLKLKGGK